MNGDSRIDQIAAERTQPRQRPILIRRVRKFFQTKPTTHLGDKMSELTRSRLVHALEHIPCGQLPETLLRPSFTSL